MTREKWQRITRVSMTALEQPERASNLFENASLAARGSLTPGVQREANEWMAAQEIRNPAAMALLVAPGFQS